jgi:hypothetical protein
VGVDGRARLGLGEQRTWVQVDVGDRVLRSGPQGGPRPDGSHEGTTRQGDERRGSGSVPQDAQLDR